MKKYFKIIVLVLIVFLTSACQKEEEMIHAYDTKLTCTLNLEDDVDGLKINSTSNIYVDYNGDEYVTKAIYQSVSSLDNYDTYLLNSLDRIVAIYNEITGISASKYIAQNNVVLEIMYNYEEIDKEKFMNLMGDLVDDDFLLKKVKTLPASLEEFTEIELQDYSCKERK